MIQKIDGKITEQSPMAKWGYTKMFNFHVVRIPGGQKRGWKLKILKKRLGTSLLAQCLRPGAPDLGGIGSIPGQGSVPQNMTKNKK